MKKTPQPKRERDQQVLVRLSLKEHKRVEIAAERLGMTCAGLARMLMLQEAAAVDAP